MFDGGFTLAAAESVCDADLDVLQSLVEKSLVRQSDERFWMLETIREYALERLDLDDAARLRRHRHAQYFLELAEYAEPELLRAGQADMLERVERDLPNIRVALAWFETTDAWNDGLRIVVALRPFWYKRGYLVEGRRWLTRFLDAETEATPARVKALATASLVAALQGDWLEAKRWGEEGRSLARALREPKYECWAALTLGRALGALGEPAAAVELFEHVGRRARETNDRDSIAMAAFNLGYAALDAGDVSRAATEFQTAAAAADDPYTVARVQAALGSVALHDGRAADAAKHLRASLRVSSELRTYDDTVAWALELLGAALCEPDGEAAALLLGAAEALREELGLRLHGIELDLHERATVTLRATIGDEALAATWADGRALSREQAVTEALSQAALPRPQTQAGGGEARRVTNL